METVILPNNNIVSGNTELNSGVGLLRIGENLNSYIIKSKIPTDSGEAEIYLCEKDGQTYVVKYYFNCKPKTEVIEKLKNIKNPAIVTLYEFGEYKDHFYEIMEYAAGGALDSKDENGKYKYLPVTEETAIQIIRETVNAFNECHKAGIIHRDIKPGNLFYKNTDGSDILVGDFGISSYYDVDDGMSKHLTQTSARTEGYTAPEVYSGVIGPEIDYYSLGVTLWELLTAKNPFMTVEEKPMFSASIMLETIQGKMADTLIARAPKLSQKMKTLIRGLMTVRHEKRWNYESVTKFLNGEEVPVYIESNQIPEVTVGETVCTSYKEIATAILADMEIGKSFVYKGGLGRYLVKIDKEFANKISDEIDEFSAKGNLEEGLFTIAYKLCPNLEFKLSEKTSFSSLTELINILETKPKELLPYLMDESKNFYLYLKVIGLGEAAKKIWEITKSSVSDYLLISKIILLLNGNSIAPFTDGVNDKIVLSDIDDVQKLSAPLKKRLLLMIDGYDKNVCAWFENQTGVNILDWRNAISDFYYPEEKMYFSKWDMFNLFVSKNYNFINEAADVEKYLANLKFLKENGNQRLVNLIIDKTWKAFYDNGKLEVCVELQGYISESTEGLKQPEVLKAVCLCEQGNYQEAKRLLENLQVEEDYKCLVYKCLAVCTYELKDYNQSLENVKKALNHKTDDCRLYELQGKNLLKQGQYKEAAAAFSLAIELEENGDFYSYRAKCYEYLAKNGAPELRKKAKEDRKRSDFVCIKKDSTTGFYICKHPVTQKEFKDVMGINPSYFRADNYDLDDEIKDSLGGDTSEHPVERVSWFDAVYYCNKRSMEEGLTPAYTLDGETDVEEWDYVPCKENNIENALKRIECNFSANGYRLPTEEEWEYAAKGGQDYTYAGRNNLDEVGWYSENSGDRTHPVEQKKANDYGLYDMSGNVCEWCWDENPNYDGYTRYYRGGSYNDYYDDCKVSCRNDCFHNYQCYNLGFRIVCSASSK